MTFIRRDLQNALSRMSKFPVIALLGPRQSGKTTLVQHFFKNHTFLSFEKPSTREFAKTDPEGFLREYENEHGLIIDEFQYVPEFLSYIQLAVDEKKRSSYFVLTGSQNFLMNSAITQSLAGRVGILTLLPFSLHELTEHKLLPERSQELVLKGGYPRIYTEAIDSFDLYSSYIHTYVERDVRQLLNVGDLHTFQTFLGLCAGRIGQEVNLTELASSCGITAPTAKRWISLLEASYIIFLLKPYFNNFNKRLTKRPKLYFYDTGLAATLLQLTSTSSLAVSPFKGPLFENLIISDLVKQFYNQGHWPSLYFWRDTNGRIEVDCLINKDGKLIPVEIKSSETITSSFFDSLASWNEISKTSPEDNYIIYAGDEQQKRKHGNVLSWKKVGTFLE